MSSKIIKLFDEKDAKVLSNSDLEYILAQLRLEDRWYVGIGHETQPTLLVPIEERPHAILFAGIAKDR